MSVRTRFAPSPTGYLHLGGLRTAAYAYVFAKANNGQFILRIEDTDRKRQVESAAEKIYSILKTFGLNWDEGPLVGGPHSPYIQSERVPGGIYKQAAEKLLAAGHAYYCFCPPQTKEEIHASQAARHITFRDPCRSLSPDEVESRLSSGEKPAIRLKVPDGEYVSYHDFVLRKDAVWHTNTVDDAMLLKSDGFPTYHLAVVVDDHDMGVTHVIRAAEWMPSTPIHLLLYRYLGYDLPQIGHPTAILDPAGGKLSKRKGNVSCEQFLADGFLPEALLNWVFLLGWAPKDNREIYTLPELVDHFNPAGFQKSNPTLNLNKLTWFNGQHIRLKSDSDLLESLRPFLVHQASDDFYLKIIPLVKPRLSNLKDFAGLTDFFFVKFKPPAFSAEEKTYLSAIHDSLSPLSWEKQTIEDALVNLADSRSWHRSAFFMALRLAVCGQRVTPPLTESMLLLGKQESLSRIKSAA